MDLVGIRFKPTGKVLQYAAQGLSLQRGEKCVAESEDGIEIATVILPPRDVEVDTQQTSVKPIIRRATVEDLEQAEAYKAQSTEAFALCRQRHSGTGSANEAGQCRLHPRWPQSHLLLYGGGTS